ncbi:hypothetical protein C8Q78DRAFT_988623 [Trametes maxima]|nr:hypothetical protein C8Q78DRAFT_988623 [Trametes maxima]
MELDFDACSMSDLREALKQLQLENRDLKNENRELQLRIGELELLVKTVPNRKHKAARLLPEGLDRQVVDHAAKRFAVLAQPWLANTGSIEVAFTQKLPELSHDSPDRYRKHTEDALLMGATSDLYHYVQTDLHQYFMHTGFRTVFTDSMGSARTALIKAIKAKAPAIFGLPQQLWTKGQGAAREEHPKIRRMLREPGLKETVYVSEFPPFLYPQLDCTRVHEIFKVQILVDSSVGTDVKSRKGGTPRTNAQCWDVNEISVGLIAMAATGGVFSLSGDESFGLSTAKTTRSKIDYYGTFHRFKAFLLETQKDPGLQRWLPKLLYWFHQRVFGPPKTVDNEQEVIDIDVSGDSESSGPDSDASGRSGELAVRNMMERFKKVAISEHLVEGAGTVGTVASSHGFRHAQVVDGARSDPSPGPLDHSPEHSDSDSDSGSTQLVLETVRAQTTKGTFATSPGSSIQRTTTTTNPIESLVPSQQPQVQSPDTVTSQLGPSQAQVAVTLAQSSSGTTTSSVPLPQPPGYSDQITDPPGAPSKRRGATKRRGMAPRTTKAGSKRAQARPEVASEAAAEEQLLAPEVVQDSRRRSRRTAAAK